MVGWSQIHAVKIAEVTMRTVTMTALLILLGATARAAEPTYLYNAKFVQAAPGRLLELIDLYKKRAPGYATSGDEAPLMIRHSQGDKWDLMLLLPVGSYSEYYQPDRVTKRKQVERQFAAKLEELIAWQEDLFVQGPPLAEL